MLESARWLAEDPLFLDTETTGLGADDEIVEIAIIDADGAVLLDTLVRPLNPITPDTTAVNGITNEMLAGAPAWAEIGPQVASLIGGRVVVAHSAEFDERMIVQTCVRHGVAQPVGVEWRCTKLGLADANNGKPPRLARAAEIVGAELPEGTAHRARHDAEIVRRIVVAAAKNEPPDAA